MSVTDATVAPIGAAARLGAFVALTKPRLNAMAVLAVAAGWWVAAGTFAPASRFAAAIAGAGLLAFGASALNQWMERDLDARMVRTRDRPLPAGRVTPAEAYVFGLALIVLGLGVLLLWTTPLAFALGALTVGTYLGIYTPLKTRTSLNTLVGAIPGALPPLLGAAAATGHLGTRAWFLFALVAAWQLPHFLAIAWLYRDDYARAGYAMLPVVTGGSGATARQVVVQGLLTVAVSLAAVPLGLAGQDYFIVALAAGVGLVVCGGLFAFRTSERSARLLLRGSLLYLPVVLLAFAALGPA